MNNGQEAIDKLITDFKNANNPYVDNDGNQICTYEEECEAMAEDDKNDPWAWVRQ